MAQARARDKAIAAVTATVTNEAVLDLIDNMDEFADMIDEAAKVVVVDDKPQEWFKRMLVVTPWVKSGAIDIKWRQSFPNSPYLPFVTFKVTGLEMKFDPVTFPTENDVIQITLALKAGQ